MSDQLSAGPAAGAGALLGVGGGAGGGGGGIASHPLYYYSTHNALRAAEGGENFFPVTFVELHGKRSCKINVYPFCDVQMVKRILLKKMNLSSCMQVRDIRLLYKGSELPNWRLMNIFTDAPFKKLHWSIRSDHLRASLRPLVSQQRLHRNLVQVIEEVKLGFRRNVAPKLTMDGTGGTYILFDARRRPVGIFKPEDEEAFAPCNPRGYEGRIGQAGFRGGVLSGEGAGREYAAHILDSLYHSYAGVPPTTMVEACHPAFCYKSPVQLSTGDHLMMDSYMSSSSSASSLKASTPATAAQEGGQQLKWKAGSLQQFAQAKESCGDYNPLLFSVSDVHRIAIFDIRVMNLDRNDGNILVAPLHTFQDITAALNHSDAPSFHEAPGRLAQHQQKMLAQQLASKLLRSVSSIGCVGRTSGNDEAAAQAAADAAQAAQALVTPDGQHTKFRLVPIDHGLILPDVIDVATFDLVWFEWPHCKMPFCEQELALIYSFNAERDAERLRRRLLMRDDCLRTLRLSTRFLQQCVRHHLNLHQIATIAARSDVDKPSALELLVRTSLERAYLTMDCASLVSTNRLGFGMLDLAELRQHDCLLFSNDSKQGSSGSHHHHHHHRRSSSGGVHHKAHRHGSKGAVNSTSTASRGGTQHHTAGKASSCSARASDGRSREDHGARGGSRNREQNTSSADQASVAYTVESEQREPADDRENDTSLGNCSRQTKNSGRGGKEEGFALKEGGEAHGRPSEFPPQRRASADCGSSSSQAPLEQRTALAAAFDQAGGVVPAGNAASRVTPNQGEVASKCLRPSRGKDEEDLDRGQLATLGLRSSQLPDQLSSGAPRSPKAGSAVLGRDGGVGVRVSQRGEEEGRRSSLEGEPKAGESRQGDLEKADRPERGKVMDSGSSASSCSCEDDEEENEDDLRCGAGRVLRASCTTTFSSFLGSRRSSSSYRWYGSGSNKGGQGTGSEGSSPGVSRDTSGRSSLLLTSAGDLLQQSAGRRNSNDEAAASDHTCSSRRPRVSKEPAVCTPGCAAAVVAEEELEADRVSELDERQRGKNQENRDSWEEEDKDSRRSPSTFTSSGSSECYSSSPSTTSTSSFSEGEGGSSLETSSVSGYESDTEREGNQDKGAGPDARAGERDHRKAEASGSDCVRVYAAVSNPGGACSSRQRAGKAGAGGLPTSASAPGLTSLPSAAFFDYPPSMMTATASFERRKDAKKRRKRAEEPDNRTSVKREDGEASRDVTGVDEDVDVAAERKRAKRKSRRKRDGAKSDAAAKRREGDGENKPPEEEQNVFAAVRGTQRGTVRRLNGTAAGSAYRRRKQQPHGVGSTWILYDMDGRSIPLDWSEPRFDRLFFECFEELLRKYIQQQHPEWPSYPYHGSRLDAQMKREREALEKKLRLQKEAAAAQAAAASASNVLLQQGSGSSSHAELQKALPQRKAAGDSSRNSVSPRENRSIQLEAAAASRSGEYPRWASSSASSSQGSQKLHLVSCSRTTKVDEEWKKGAEGSNRQTFSSERRGSSSTRATRFAAS